MPEPEPESDGSGQELLGRLRALDRIRAAGPLPVEVFERLTRTATQVAGVPTGLTSLIDDERQTFIAHVGLGEPWASRGEAPLSQSFCRLVAETGVPLIVSDGRTDDRVREHPAVQEHGVVAYVGMPLRAGGLCVGVLCLLDGAPRTWSSRELLVLSALAESATAELELHVALARKAATDRLSTGEARYRSLAAAMADGVVLQDRFGCIHDCNAAARRILGITLDEMVGRYSVDPRWRTVYPDGTDMPGAAHPAMRTLDTGAPLRDEIVGIHKPDGELVWLSVSTEPLFDERGGTASVVITFADITERMLAESRRDQQLTEQRALRDLATLVASQAAPPAVFTAAAQYAAHVLGASAGGVARLSARGEASLVGAWVEDHLPEPEVGETIDLDAATATGSVLGTGLAAARTTPCTYLRRSDEGSSLASPITVDGKLWGALSVAYDTVLDGREAREKLERLGRFAELVGLGISSAEARDQLARQATVDHLTGLDNQRAFSDRLDQEVLSATRLGQPLSLVVFDIDHFKLVNDTHGHSTGNEVLVAFADRLREACRGSEAIARVGGEEFAWILPGTRRADALAAAERVRRSIQAAPFGMVGRLTTSAGVCELGDAGDAGQLFRHADMALYRAKAEGRNTTVAYEPGTLELLSGDEQARRLEAATTLAAIRALASAVDAKDPSTQRHSERVAQLTADLAVQAGWQPREVALLRDAALVHDIGKIGIPDRVLLKPGRLTAAEYTQIKAHSALGAEMVDGLLTAQQIAWIRHHHERFDGRGYPDCIAGQDISEGARLMAVADSWDAMTVARPYATPKTTAEALVELRRAAGSQLCPEAVDCLLLLRTGAAASAA